MATQHDAKWIIEDWAGNRKFPDKEFATFEDGWAFLHTQFSSEDDLQEFYVLQNEE